MPSSRGSFQPRDQMHVSNTSCIGRQVLYHKCYLGNTPLHLRPYVCVYIYIYIYMYIYMYICVYIYIHVYRYDYKILGGSLPNSQCEVWEVCFFFFSLPFLSLNMYFISAWQSFLFLFFFYYEQGFLF